MDSLVEKVEEAEKALTPDEKRFLLDLEFLQCLANPSYLQCSFWPIHILVMHENNSNPLFKTLFHTRPSIWRIQAWSLI